MSIGLAANIVYYLEVRFGFGNETETVKRGSKIGVLSSSLRTLKLAEDESIVAASESSFLSPLMSTWPV